MIKEIKPFKEASRYLRNGDHINMHNTILGHGGMQDAMQINETIFDAGQNYEAVVNHEQMVMQTEKADPETPFLHTGDASRDADIAYVFSTIRAAARYSKLQDRYMAAQNLIHIVNTYKGITKQGQTTETGLIKNMLVAFDTPVSKAALATLGLQPIINSLKATNEQFNILWSSRASEEEASRVHGTVKESRTKSDEALYNFGTILSGAYRSGFLTEAQKTAVGEFIDFINAQIVGYVGVLIHRNLKNKPDKPDPDEDADGGEINIEPPPFG
jgi:hypothetical protein